MSRARFRYRARPKIGPFRINIARGRGVLPRVSSVSVKAGPLTWNPKRRTASVDTPGIGSVMIPYGGAGRTQGAVTTRGSRLVDPELDAWAVKYIACPRQTCAAQLGKPCVTPSGARTRCHMQRREVARAQRHYGPDTTPGGRSTRPGPISPLGQLVRRALGWFLVLALARVYVLALGDPGSAPAVIATITHR